MLIDLSFRGLFNRISERFTQLLLISWIMISDTQKKSTLCTEEKREIEPGFHSIYEHLEGN